MFGPISFRWVPAIVFLVALPVALRSQPTFSIAPSATESSVAANEYGDVPFVDRATDSLPKLTPEQMGDLLEVRERYQAAIVSYAQVEHPSAAVWNKMGIANQMMYNLKEALRCYKESLRIDAANPNVLNNLATVEDSTGQFPAAERNYRKALMLQPGSALILKNLGTNLLMQHRYDKGAAAYEQALAINPHIFESKFFGPRVNDPAPKRERGTANYFKARSCARAGMDDCALTYLNKAFDEGSATVKKISEEPDFAKLRGTTGLQRLFANQQ